jgi:hypothetical protein
VVLFRRRQVPKTRGALWKSRESWLQPIYLMWSSENEPIVTPTFVAEYLMKDLD